MKYTEFKGQKIARMMLGTVQLGMDYGLGEYTAKPSMEYAFSILDAAVKSGVNVLDTANNYGDSERVIGEWLKTVDIKDRPLIATKIDTFDGTSAETVKADIIRQTEGCLKTLGVEQLDILMVHSYQDYKVNPEVVKSTFKQLKDEGKIKFSGISAYSEDDYEDIAKSGFDFVQIPLNIFDWGQIESGGIKKMADAGMHIVARSVFLQGVVFFKSTELVPEMQFCKKYVEKFEYFCEKFNLNAPELAMSFVLSVPGVGSVVLGCQRVEQVEQNSKLIDRTRQLTDEEMSEIREAFLNIDPKVIDPRLWFNKF